MTLLGLHLVLTLLWATATGSLELVNLFVGFVVGGGVLHFAGPALGDPRYGIRALRIVGLTLFFFRELVVSSVRVAIDVLRPRLTMTPALIAYSYLVLPLVALIWLRNDPELGRAAIFWLLATVWAIDICAYFSGRFIGGPKLAPSISPKKTWAGLVGGMAGAAAIGVITSLWIGAGSPALLALIGIGMTVLEQAGDFFESALKRRAGVKDSGTLIPGHGGILDRVDGLVAVAAGAALLALLHNATHPGAGVLIWP